MAWKCEDPQECTGEAELQGSCRKGQGCNEGGGTTVAPQGADSEEEFSDVKSGTKRSREFKRRTGCRRSRASVIESDEDDENVELVRRGVTKVDCKRRCGDSSVS